MAEKKKDIDTEVALYDLGYHLVDTLTEDEISVEVRKLHELLEKHGASILHESVPRKLALAYTISRMTKGKREDYHAAYFGTIIFEISRASVPSFEESLRGQSVILRHLLIETDQERAEETLKAIKGPEKAEDVPAVSEEELDKSIESLSA